MLHFLPNQWFGPVARAGGSGKLFLWLVGLQQFHLCTNFLQKLDKIRKKNVGTPKKIGQNKNKKPE